jgi:hypothetical protein
VVSRPGILLTLRGLVAIEDNIAQSDEFFIGGAYILEFEIFELDEVTPLDASLFEFEYVLAKHEGDDEPLISKINDIAVVGAFNSDPALNTQRVEVSLTATETSELKPGLYRHTLWRTNEGDEAVLTFGSVVARRAVSRAA